MPGIGNMVLDLDQLTVFRRFFAHGPGQHAPYPYQEELALGEWRETLVVPTGFGKTAAVLAAWLWKIGQGDAVTPRRLVYCLPMRSLVEQTADAARGWIAAADEALGFRAQCDVIMGGVERKQGRIPSWIRNPEQPTILIGTQDLLVSGALMRGYGVSRYRWPVDFALLHNDAMWIVDEVQLTGATLATSAQLEGFRRKMGVERGARTLWMSATLDPAWLRSPDFEPVDSFRPHDLGPADLGRAAQLWQAKKKLSALPVPTIEGKNGIQLFCAGIAAEARNKSTPRATTLVFVNTVARAQAVYQNLRSSGSGPEVVLLHSRFRPPDRKGLLETVLSPPPARGRIVVATQALEAGVDITSAVLITEIAPWSSLVQRFGRCNRYGECGEAGSEVFWADLGEEDAKPYDHRALAEARSRLAGLSGCGPADLAGVPPSAPDRGQMIRKRDLLDLFDTESDLSGFDVDVSPYVRHAEDTDVLLFWRPLTNGRPEDGAPAPAREELCPAPIGGARELLRQKGVQAWRWDPLGRVWAPFRSDELFPGCMVWVDSAAGGYDSELGFEPTGTEPVQPVLPHSGRDGNEALGSDPDSEGDYSISLAKHTEHVRTEIKKLADSLGLSAALPLFDEIALWHDFGKAHPSFVALAGGAWPPLAKFPRRTQPNREDTRRYFRHELASALAFLDHRAWSEEATLAAYLIAAHHGKVRLRLRALPKEAEAPGGRLFARGVWDADPLPATEIGESHLPDTALRLEIMQLGEGGTGNSWGQRTQDLLKKYGPFRLAWLEAVVRIADWRASAAEEQGGRDDL